MRRQQISLQTSNGNGIIAAVEFGPQSRPLDILFLHANGFNALTYRHVLATLDPALHLLAIDLRGHGRTTLPVPAAHPGWQIYADDLLALINALDASPRLIAGHSMGASTALLAARLLPPGVRQLILFEPVIISADQRASTGGRPMWDIPLVQGALRRKPHYASREEAFNAYSGRGAFRTWQEAMLRDYLEDGLIPADNCVTLACPPVWEAANFATTAIADPRAGLLDCGLPLTIFAAVHGSTCSLEETSIPATVSIHTLPGTSHFLPMERPDVVCKALVGGITALLGEGSPTKGTASSTVVRTNAAT